MASGLMKEKIAVALPWANGQNLDGIESISEKPTGHRFQGPVTSSTTLPSTRRRGYSLSAGIRVSHLENVGETERNGVVSTLEHGKGSNIFVVRKNIGIFLQSVLSFL